MINKVRGLAGWSRKGGTARRERRSLGRPASQPHRCCPHVSPFWSRISLLLTYLFSRFLRFYATTFAEFPSYLSSISLTFEFFYTRHSFLPNWLLRWFWETATWPRTWKSSPNRSGCRDRTSRRWRTCRRWSKRCRSTRRSSPSTRRTCTWPRTAWRSTRATSTNYAKLNR